MDQVIMLEISVILAAVV